MFTSCGYPTTIAGWLFIYLLLWQLPQPLLAQSKALAPVYQVRYHKLAAPLQATIVSGRDSVRVLLTDPDKAREWLKQQDISLKATVSPDIYLASLSNPAQLQALQNCPWVKYIDRTSRTPREELELKDADFSANYITAVHGLYPHLNGQGVAASVKENAFDASDVDFKGRVISSPFLHTASSSHATTMATIIAGGGNSAPAGKGIAWNAKIASADFAELMPDDSQQLLEAGVSVQNHSYGVGPENYYGLESYEYDRQVRRFPTLLHIFSSGNSGNLTPETGPYAGIPAMANLTGQFKLSKNTLSVGALDADGKVGTLSSRGPAYDGRIKPELVAHGAGGTSEASAVVSGIALLVQQAYKEVHNGLLPSAALVKAILINSADDRGAPEADFESGFGNADAIGAVQAVLAQRHFSGEATTGSSQIFRIQVPEGTQQLKVTLVWHEPEAEPDAPAALVNDLDLVLRHPTTGTEWLPWVLNAYPHPDSLRLPAKRGIDRTNNVEQITLLTPAAGVYEIQVEGHQVTSNPQVFEIAYEYEATPQWIYPSKGSNLSAAGINRIRWQAKPASAAATKARLEFKGGGTENWVLVADNIDVALGYYDWSAPAISSTGQLRISTAEEVLYSEEFILSATLQPAIALYCGNTLLLQWDAIPYVSEYALYQLGATHLELMQTISDTLVVLEKHPGDDAQLYAVAPVLSGLTGNKSRGLRYDPQQELCYIKTFLPRQLVMDTVVFDLELSTNYNLASIRFEKWQQGAFQTIQTLSPAQSLRFTLEDLQATPGLNRYRVKATDIYQNTYYSSVEEVFNSDKGFIQVAPNPVVAGQNLEVLAGEGDGVARIQLISPVGKLMYETADSGALKTIPTTGLTKGLYLLRIYTAKGEILTSRVVIL
ncbi:S8 family serine peptidase [Pontibacter sp. SGAir0037]|uniref:S8 family serine peptidase n=1 Tax=Pontibacter sp. SGAir0037 TaxID=2571030 RepID=UPI0010CD5D2C|nr:S8 family serine peptidase [Pontibacter sp. SGAir0037]QCR24405.1 hypothetical protein C1N53_19955 [Pontibacter sp. SGAir0037]